MLERFPRGLNRDVSDDAARFRQEILRYCSPEFQREEARKWVDEHQRQKEEQERQEERLTAQRKKERERSAMVDLMSGLALTVFYVLLVGGSIYLFVKFVKWAWIH